MKSVLINIGIALLVLLQPSVYGQEVALKPYQKGNWSNIVSEAKGKPIAVHFWGVTCPPCVKEMPQWGEFLKRNPKAKVVFIQVDDVSQASIQKMLNKSGVVIGESYFVSGPFDERMRYEIDPQWHGETPTTFLIDRNGKVTRKTGASDFLQLQSFLSRSS